MDHQARLIAAIAGSATRRIVRRLVRSLQKLGADCLLSGDDSGLVNVWDEICAQVQSEASFFWDAYDHTVRTMVVQELAKCPETELSAIWLQTDAGFDWMYDEETEDKDAIPWDSDDIEEYVLNELYSLAERWTNKRIRKFVGW